MASCPWRLGYWLCGWQVPQNRHQGGFRRGQVLPYDAEPWAPLCGNCCLSPVPEWAV